MSAELITTLVAVVGVGVSLWVATWNMNRGLRRDMEARFDRTDARFDRMETRFDARFAQVDARFDKVEHELGEIRTDIVELKIAVARLEGPQPRLLNARG